jgi:hypothetical protein
MANVETEKDIIGRRDQLEDDAFDMSLLSKAREGGSGQLLGMTNTRGGRGGIELGSSAVWRPKKRAWVMTSSLRMLPSLWRRAAPAALLGTEEEECIMGECSSFYNSNYTLICNVKLVFHLQINVYKFIYTNSYIQNCIKK